MMYIHFGKREGIWMSTMNILTNSRVTRKTVTHLDNQMRHYFGEPIFVDEGSYLVYSGN